MHLRPHRPHLLSWGDLTFVFTYNGGPDNETHTWTAVQFDEIVHGFAENVHCRHSEFACAVVVRQANHVTVKDCCSKAMISKITGSRHYSFYVEGGGNLFTGCTADTGRVWQWSCQARRVP